MKISILKKDTDQCIVLNNLLLKNSIELKSITDLDTLIEKIGEAKYVLLGEASHGKSITHGEHNLAKSCSSKKFFIYCNRE